jgi:acyl-CoA synthetase (AMP-forming)/AMP-acid ligase II
VISHRSNLHFVYASMLGGAAHMMLHGFMPGGRGPACAISASPLFHISGMNAQLVMAPGTGMTIVYPPVGRWEESTHLSLTERYGATSWSLVPTQLWRVLGHPDFEKYDLSSLKLIGGGSSTWPPELLRLVGEKLPWVRPALSIGYGMSESNGLGTSLRAPLNLEHPDSVGEPGPGVEIEVRDAATDEPLPEGAVGEICMRTAALFTGYWDNPEATRAALDDERWYRTGDAGHIAGGLLYLEGRRRDLIIRGGENVYPAEIENRLMEHSDVEEVAVIGVPHPVLGQEVKAFVVLKPGASLDADAVRAWAGEALASFKVPTYVEFRTELPHNAVGKVLKHLLEQPEKPADFVEE